MTDTEKKIAEIREALEKDTPGKWEYMPSIHSEFAYEVYVDTFFDPIVASVIRKEDANLIANAPEWLRFLLDEREKMIEWIKSALVGAMKESCRHETPDPTWHCCDWAELVEKAREIGVMVE